MKKYLILCLLLFSCSAPKHTSRSVQTIPMNVGTNLATAFPIVNLALDQLNRIGVDRIVATAEEMNILHNGQGPNSISISSIPTIPTINYAAGDTSNYPVPGKIGDIYIDTSGAKVYMSKSAARNGWLKLN